MTGAEPPPVVDGAEVLAWALSDGAPLALLPVVGELGERLPPIPIVGLLLARYPGSTAIYRFSCSRGWTVEQDAAYPDVESAQRLPNGYPSSVAWTFRAPAR